MAKDTFEAENKNKLETYEWDDMWWDNNKTGDSRILIIGDSISRGYRYILKEVTGKSWKVDNFATSKAIDNEFFKKALDMAISQQEKYDLILFNNGLHGWHLETSEYEKNYEEMLKYLLTKNIRLAVILATPLQTEKNSLVKERNEAAKRCAGIYSLPVIDLYSAVEDKKELFIADKVHLSPEGYKKLAETIYEKAKEILNK